MTEEIIDQKREKPILFNASKTENLIKVFDQKGTFAALNAAEKFLRERGFSFASSCAVGPQGILFGNYMIAKWRNLTVKERAQLHGVITGDGREGPVRVTLSAFAPEAVKRAFLSEVRP
jgi:hypothetical protein